MADVTVKEKLRATVADSIGVNPVDVKDDSNFADDLGVDSLDAVELIMAVEETFQVDIPDEDAEKLTTFQVLLEYIAEKGFTPHAKAP